MLVYIGTYTEPGFGHAEGISVFEFDPEVGALTAREPVAGIKNPSFLALSADKSTLYAVNELDDGAISAFARDSLGGLTLVNRQSTHGAHPCFVSIDGSGKFALVANYNGQTVAALPILE